MLCDMSLQGANYIEKSYSTLNLFKISNKITSIEQDKSNYMHDKH